MKLAKQAIQFYVDMTGNVWSDFFTSIDSALSEDINNQDGDMWLVHSILNTLESRGISVGDLKINKDAIKAIFDESGRKSAGEFFTPEVWCKEGRKYLTKHVENWKDYYVWDASCYTMDTEIYIRRHVGYGLVDTKDELCKDIISTALAYGISLMDVNVTQLNNVKTILEERDNRKKCHPRRFLSREDFALICKVPSEMEVIHNKETNEIHVTGWVTYYGLLDTDEVFAYDKATRDTKWCGFHRRFTRESDNLYKFVGKSTNGNYIGKAHVTGDHMMYVLWDGLGVEVSAERLAQQVRNGCCAIEMPVYDEVTGRVEFVTLSPDCVSDDKNFMYIGGKHPDVWDITMNNYHIFLTRYEGCNVFSKNCGSGNLMRTSSHPREKLFLSTLQEDDVALLKETKEYEGATIFQCDFLSGIDYDIYNTEFVSSLPEELQDVLKNDKPLIIYMNPPYKSGMGLSTDVGRYMNQTGLGAPSYDIFYQFCWRVYSLVDMFNLKNCYYEFFGPVQFFVASSPKILMQEFERKLKFVDGMCIAAQEFSDTSSSIEWGIACSLWKACPDGYWDDASPVLLEKKYMVDGEVQTGGRVLYEYVREKLKDWVVPKDILFYDDAPMMTSHLTFKNGVVNDKVADISGKIASNALGTMMTGNNLARGANRSAVLSMPTSLEYVSITEENFWRCVASFGFRRTADVGWELTKKESSAPKPELDGYDIWLKNALVLFLFEYKSMMSSMRNVSWRGSKYTVRNKLFYLSEEQVRAECQNEDILEDLDNNPPLNQFILKCIEESKSGWTEDTEEFFNWCCGFTLGSYNYRRIDGVYENSIECWDASLVQLRGSGLWSDELEERYGFMLNRLKDYLRKDVERLGFISGEIIE